MVILRDKSSLEDSNIAYIRAYWKLLKALKPSKIRLTKYVALYVTYRQEDLLPDVPRQDDLLVNSFLEAFPEFDDDARLSNISDEDLKTASAKSKWRSFMKEWEKDIGKQNASSVAASAQLRLTNYSYSRGL